MAWWITFAPAGPLHPLPQPRKRSLPYPHPISRGQLWVEMKCTLTILFLIHIPSFPPAAGCIYKDKSQRRRRFALVRPQSDTDLGPALDNYLFRCVWTVPGEIHWATLQVPVPSEGCTTLSGYSNAGAADGRYIGAHLGRHLCQPHRANTNQDAVTENDKCRDAQHSATGDAVARCPGTLARFAPHNTARCSIFGHLLDKLRVP